MAPQFLLRHSVKCARSGKESVVGKTDARNTGVRLDVVQEKPKGWVEMKMNADLFGRAVIERGAAVKRNANSPVGAKIGEARA